MNKWQYDSTRTFPITSYNPLKLFNTENKLLEGKQRPQPQYHEYADDDGPAIIEKV